MRAYLLLGSRLQWIIHPYNPYRETETMKPVFRHRKSFLSTGLLFKPALHKVR